MKYQRFEDLPCGRRLSSRLRKCALSPRKASSRNDTACETRLTDGGPVGFWAWFEFSLRSWYVSPVRSHGRDCLAGG